MCQLCTTVSGFILRIKFTHIHVAWNFFKTLHHWDWSKKLFFLEVTDPANSMLALQLWTCKTFVKSIALTFRALLWDRSCPKNGWLPAVDRTSFCCVQERSKMQRRDKISQVTNTTGWGWIAWFNQAPGSMSGTVLSAEKLGQQGVPKEVANDENVWE